VSDEELIAGSRQLARTEGIFASPEGGACVPALRRLIDRGLIAKTEKVVMFNTGAAVKYLDAFESPDHDTAFQGPARMRVL
jgi:threonine synthase